MQIQMGVRRRGTAPKVPRAIRVGPNALEKNPGVYPTIGYLQK